MNMLQQYFDALAEKNAEKAVSFLSEDVRYDDTCLSGMFHTETHLFGRAALAMHFQNRFIFKTYLVLEGKAESETEGEYTVMIVGKPTKVHAKVEAFAEDGTIRHLSLCEAE